MRVIGKVFGVVQREAVVPTLFGVRQSRLMKYELAARTLQVCPDAGWEPPAEFGTHSWSGIAARRVCSSAGHSALSKRQHNDLPFLGPNTQRPSGDG